VEIRGTIAVMPLVPVEANGCFELFGFDILVDEMLHPWLLEVNAAPALAAGSDVDWAVKEPLLRDLIGLLDFHNSGTHDALDQTPLKKRVPGSRGRKGAAGHTGGSGPTVRGGLAGAGGARPRPGSGAKPPAVGGGRLGLGAEPELDEAGNAAGDMYRSAAKKFGGYEMIFPFSKKMSDASEQCANGTGGKVVAEQGKVVRAIVEEVRRLEEAAAVEAARGGEGRRLL
jgi:hypothetical protein